MRKPLVALAVGAGVFALVAAGAATLTVTGTVPQAGSIVNPTTCGAVTAAVDFAAEGDTVGLVTVALQDGTAQAVATCDTQKASVILLGAADATLDGEYSLTISETGVVTADFGGAIDLADVENVSVVIADTTAAA